MKASLTCLAVLLATLPAHAQRVSVTAIPGGAGLEVLGGGVNNRGQVVGRISDPVDGSSQAFVWSEAAGLQALGTLGGSTGWASAINDRGQIVGLSTRAGSTALLGYIAQPGGALQALPMLLGRVAGINSAGQVLAMDMPPKDAYLYADGLAHRVLTSADDSLRVSGLSDAGHIAGTMRFIAGGTIEPFIRDAASGISTRLFAGQPSVLSSWREPSVSPDGRYVVGALTLDTAPSDARAYLWEGGVLSLLLGDAPAGAKAVNNTGMAVGWSQQGGDLHAMLWLNGRALDVHALAGLGAGGSTGQAINGWGQVVLSHREGALQATSLVTLHPDWAGGDGDWATSARWRYGGLDAIALAPGPMHDVVVRPAGSTTVRGAATADVRSLVVGGKVGEVVTLDLNGGTTLAREGSWLAAQSVLTGSGRLSGALLVDQGARIEVAAGQRVQLSGGGIDHAGSTRVGTGAVLEVGGGLLNRAPGEVRVTQGSATFAGAVTNEGHVLASGAELNFAGGLVNAGQLGVSFGTTVVGGAIANTGVIVVSNGAQASFAGAITNAGELRISTGGAANFFGVVSGAGRISGGGQARFEGGLSGSGHVAVEAASALGAAAVTTLALDGANELDFSQAVHIEGGALRLGWAAAAGATAGQHWDLFDWQGGVSGRFDSLQLPTLATGLVWNTEALYSSGEIRISAVPEPGTWGLLAAGLTAIAWRRRRLPA